jgi:hypothetical protein
MNPVGKSLLHHIYYAHILLHFLLGSLMLNNVFVLGSDEGLYAWVVANYALGTLGGDPLQTTGIIELGGASAQV